MYDKTKVLESKSHNAPIFEQRDIMGVDEYSVIDKFLKNVLISDNMVKYKFNEHYDKKLKKYKENIVGFNKTIIKYQLVYFIKDQYTKNLTEVTSAKNVDGLSGMDKLEMNMQKIDEGLTIMAELNIKNELRRIERDNDFGITDETIKKYQLGLEDIRITIPIRSRTGKVINIRKCQKELELTIKQNLTDLF